MGPTASPIRYLILLLAGSVAFGEDFKLSDGTTLRGVRVLEVRPDALVVAHDKGVAMADLDKLPRAIRTRYNYDPKRAASYRERDLTARRTVAEENRRLIAAQDERKRAVARAEWEAATAEGTPAASGSGEIRFTPRESTSQRAFVAEVGRQVDEAEAARKAANAPVTFWTAPFWNVLKAVLGSGGGARDTESNSEPRNWR
jgi:hypothetical protein